MNEEIVSTNQKINDWVNNKVNYIVIFITSLLVLATLPFIGSAAGLGLKLPDTVAGWIVWSAVRIVLAIANVMIYIAFIKEGIKEARATDKFKKSNEKMIEMCINKPNSVKEPMSPNKWNRKTYGMKSVNIITGTLGASFAITQAILAFDWVSFLTYLLTIGGCILFGFQKKATTYDYWSDEYGDWVDIQYERYKKEIIENDQDRQQGIS